MMHFTLTKVNKTNLYQCKIVYILMHNIVMSPANDLYINVVNTVKLISYISSHKHCYLS